MRNERLGVVGADAACKIKVTLSADTLRMLRVLAADAAARDGGALNLSAVVTELVERRWREVGGPQPPLVPEAPPNGVLRGRAA